MLTKEQAERRGSRLLARMRGRGWRLRVWENIGWHYAVENGPLSVYPSTLDGMFFALLGRDPGTGEGIWSANNSHSSDPNDAATNAVTHAREVVDRYVEVVARAEQIFADGQKSPAKKARPR